MKIVELKRIKVLGLVLIAFVLILLSYKGTRRLSQHLDGLDRITKMRHSNKYKIGQNQKMSDGQQDFKKLKDSFREEEYTISQKDLYEKYQSNLEPIQNNDYVDYIPKNGKVAGKVAVASKQTGLNYDAPTGDELPYDELPAIDQNTETTNKLKKSKNIFYEKDHFIRIKNSFRGPGQQNHFGTQVPVYNMPKIRANFILDKAYNKFNQQKQKTETKNTDNIKDYEVFEGKDVEMESGEEYALIHNFQASKLTHTPQNTTNFPTSVPQHHYIFTSHKFPKSLMDMPTFGNGYVGGVVGGREVHLSGVYMGNHSHSHRASVPATFFHKLSVSDASNALLFTKTYSLDVSKGIYSEEWKHPLHNLVQRVYAHRTIKNLVVSEVEYRRGFRNVKSTKIEVALYRWSGSTDITFSEKDSGDKEISYKVGRVNGQETMETTHPLVHVMYDHMPPTLTPSKSFRKTKWVFLTSYGHSENEVRQAYEEGRKKTVGMDQLIREHVQGWGALWKNGRVDVEGVFNEEGSTSSHLARSIYSSLYYLLSSLPLDFNDGFRGLSESGLPFGNLEYPQGSRVKVSQELSIFPPLLLLHTDMAKHLLKSRKLTAQGALKNARDMQRRGMLYAFESGYTGVELSMNQKRCDLSPYVTASVSMAISQFFYATDNVEFVNDTFSPILFNIAEYLQSRLYPANDAFHVNNQIALDESHGKISDSPLSNCMIKKALSFPHIFNSRLLEPPISQFLTAERLAKDAEKVYMPPLSRSLITPFKGYNFGDKLDEADVVMLTYPMMLNMTNEMKMANTDFYDQKTLPTASMTSKAMFLISWLSLGRQDKAHAILNSFLTLNNKPFRTWSPSTKSSSKLPNHLPSMGAFLQTLLHGFVGCRIRKDRLDITATLPFNTSSLHVVGVDYLQHSINIHIESASLRLMVTKKHPEAPSLVAHVYSDESRYQLPLNRQVSLPRTRVAILSQSVAESFSEKLA